MKDVHELGKGVPFHHAARIGSQRGDLISDRGEPEKAHQGDLHQVLQIAELDVEHREGEYQPPDEGNIKAESQWIEQQAPVIDPAQEGIKHHQDEDGDKPEDQGKEHAGGGDQDAREVDLLQQARGAGEALATLHQGLGEKVVVQDADHQVEDVVRQIAAEDVGENEVIDEDHGQRIAQGPEEAQSRALVAHLEILGDQVAHQIAVLPITAEASGCCYLQGRSSLTFLLRKDVHEYPGRKMGSSGGHPYSLTASMKLIRRQPHESQIHRQMRDTPPLPSGGRQFRL